MAFVLDTEGNFAARANAETITWNRMSSLHWETKCRALIAEHALATDSKWSNAILDDWDRWKGQFWQIVPKEMLTRLAAPLTDAEQLIAAE